MPRIGEIPEWFWHTPSMRAAEPELAYVGRMPKVSGDYYALEHLFPPPPAKHAWVYILLACDGSVLYVGKARRPGNRFDRHRHRDWWDEVENLVLIRVQGGNREEADVVALHVERLGIRHLHPLYNVMGVRR